MNSMRALFIMVALAAGILCFYFGNKKIKEIEKGSHNEWPYKVTESGVNGGAIGMGIISGMSLAALGMTYIGRKEE